MEHLAKVVIAVALGIIAPYWLAYQLAVMGNGLAAMSLGFLAGLIQCVWLAGYYQRRQKRR